MSWQHLDAEGNEVQHGERYVYTLTGCQPILGLVKWDSRHGYVIYPDDKPGQKFALAFKYKSGQVLIYQHLKKEQQNERATIESSAG